MIPIPENGFDIRWLYFTTLNFGKMHDGLISETIYWKVTMFTLGGFHTNSPKDWSECKVVNCGCPATSVLQGYRKKRVILIRSFNVRFLNSSNESLNLLHVVHANCPNYIFKVDYLIRFQLGRLRIDRHFMFNIMKDAKINTPALEVGGCVVLWSTTKILKVGIHIRFWSLSMKKTTRLSH